jgi:hypothetical protein
MAAKFRGPTAQIKQEVQLEIEEIVKRVKTVRQSIEDAFEKGSIDFDQITTELEAIENELQAKGVALALNPAQQQILKTKELTDNKKIIPANDYK